MAIIEILFVYLIFSFALGFVLTPHRFKSIGVRNEIRLAVKDLYIKGGKYINRPIEFKEKEFCRVWSESYFNKNYNFSFNEVKEIIQWGWDNRDFIKQLVPWEMAYSRYNIVRESILRNKELMEFQ